MIFYNYVWSIYLDYPVSMDVKIPLNGGIFVFSDFWWFMFPPISFTWQTEVFTQKTSGCTDLIYHADLYTLWVLARDSQTQDGQ